MKRKAFIRLRGGLTWWDGWAEIINGALVKTWTREYGVDTIYSQSDIEIMWADAPQGSKGADHG